MKQNLNCWSFNIEKMRRENRFTPIVIKNGCHEKRPFKQIEIKKNFKSINKINQFQASSILLEPGTEK